MGDTDMTTNAKSKIVNEYVDTDYCLLSVLYTFYNILITTVRISTKLQVCTTTKPKPKPQKVPIKVHYLKQC